MSQYESSMSSRYGVREDVGGRARHMAEEARDYLGQGYHNAEDLVTSHPAASALVVFGVGLGIGILLGSTIAHSIEQRSHSSSLRINRRKAERFGRQVLDSISEYLPESLTSRMG